MSLILSKQDIRGRWESDTEGQVLCDFHGDGNKTITFRASDFPVAPWQVAISMNEAFASGYRAAQQDMRRALGIAQW